MRGKEKSEIEKKKERNGSFMLQQNDTASTRILRHTSSRPIILEFYTYSLKESRGRGGWDRWHLVLTARGLTVKPSFSLKAPSRVLHSFNSIETYVWAGSSSVFCKVLHRNCLGKGTFLNGGKIVYTENLRFRRLFGSKNIYSSNTWHEIPIQWR